METVKVGELTVVLDEKEMEFNETNLNNFIMKEHGVFSHLISQLADVEHAQWVAEEEYEQAYSEKFTKFKEEGGSDKFVEARCKADMELFAKKKRFLELKRDAAKIRGHLRAWDKAHENAQSFGHNLRKEMDKLGNDIKFRSDPGLEVRLEEIMKKSQSKNIDNYALDDNQSQATT